MKPEVLVEIMYDGWSITVDDRRYTYDHNDPDYGAKELVQLFEDLEYYVEEKEVC